jgi:hypothetical protein
MDTIKDRTKWAIDYVIKTQHLSNVKLAEMMDIATGTINSYRRMTTTPNIEFILQFCELFTFSLLWFVEGIGYPFKDAWKTYPESKGPKPVPKPPDIPGLFGPHADEPFIPPKSDDEKNSLSNTGFSIAEDLTLAAKVLESNTHYATALHLNIRSFAGAVNDSATLNGVIGRLEDLEGKFEKLQTENKDLKDEIKKLKGNCGGSPPIALAMDHAALTGTENQGT